MNIRVNNRLQNNPWLVIRKPRPQAKFRLFCFPYAGGGASVYREWPELMPEEIEVCIIQYPGRENRIAEKPIDDLGVMVSTLFNILLPKMDLPYVFFGHSLGAKIAFETAKKLSKDRGYDPTWLFASGCRSAHMGVNKQIHHLNDADFTNALRRYDGTPEAVLQNIELMEMMLPMLRADFILDEKYTSNPEEKVKWPIYAFAGDNDDIAPVFAVEQWTQITEGEFRMKVFKGEHFFFKSNLPLLFELMTKVFGVSGRKKFNCSSSRNNSVC